MSAFCGFEVITQSNPEEVQKGIASILKNTDKSFSVIPDEKGVSLLCPISYFWEMPYEETILREVAQYLLSISLNGKILYYPNGEHFSLFIKDPPIPISLSEIFMEEYRPTMTGQPVLVPGYEEFPLYKSIACEIKTGDENPFIEASRNGQTELLKNSIDHGIDINTAYRSGETALIVALKYKKNDSADFLIKAGANIELKDWYGTPIHWAIENENEDIVFELIARHANIHTRTKTTAESTCLMIAAARGNIAITNALLSAGAEVNSVDILDRTALHYALGHTIGYFDSIKLPWIIDIVSMLIKHKADVNAAAQDGWTPWMCAYASENKELVALLEAAGAATLHGRFPYQSLL